VADSELDDLYRAAPEDFTAERTRLAKAAKQRGDTDAAKRIAASRKPTTSAWVVNQLVHEQPDARERLSDLGERLRAAHAAMDGEHIRVLSGEQRRLVEELSRAALRLADVANPSAALRDDVTDTLQAAVADPDVTARLGRLTKAEKWSGFGEFGDTAVVSSTKPRPAAKPAEQATSAEQAEPAEDRGAQRAERERRDKARAVVTAAERAKAQADEALAERQSDLATARLKRDDAQRRVAAAQEAMAAAEAALAAAEQVYADAKQASRDAGDLVKEAKAALTRGS
jgi:hypothetical protein